MVLHVVHITTLQSLIAEITGLSQQQAKISKDLFVALLFGLKMTSSVCLVSRVAEGDGDESLGLIWGLNLQSVCALSVMPHHHKT